LIGLNAQDSAIYLAIKSVNDKSKKLDPYLFETSAVAIDSRVSTIDPITYGRTRNFVDGAVTYISPYISRGVISTKQVLTKLLEQGHAPKQIEKFIQELTWRDYWQQVWSTKGDAIDVDLKNPQTEVTNQGIPEAITMGQTGIEAIDKAIETFYRTGYLHNHVRMYIASIACNVAKSHWNAPAKWMYYHLLDGDWASNALSWQWVAGTNSNKKYYANQDNINKYCHTKQQDTFLDHSYEELPKMAVPSRLSHTIDMKLTTNLPESTPIVIDTTLPSLIYNFYNLDPNWKKGVLANRILLLEPSHFKKYPISEKSIRFMLDLGKNIEGLQVFVGEFQDLMAQYHLEKTYYKEHPTNQHYRGIQEPRDWLFTVEGYYPSFFAFWKKCKKELVW